MKQIGKRMSCLLLLTCLILAMLPTMAAAAGEEFSLPTGQTYYFDLSSEVGNIGTVRTEVPDPTLHYVPFTYAGTVNAYSLDSSSSGFSNASATATASDRNLFVADYALSHSIAWNTLNTNSLIFGKTYDTNYTLRSLSVGNTTGASGTPSNNEWDRILDKDSSLIKNWSFRSLGQDTLTTGPSIRGARGGVDKRSALGISSNESPAAYGFKPALEVLNVGALGTDGLRAVTLELGDGSVNGDHVIDIVSAGGQFKVPSGTGLTPPANMTFYRWQQTGDASTTYNVGDTVTYTTGLGLTAIWKEATPNITIDYANEQLTGFDASGSYTIDGIAVSPVSGKLEVADYLGTTITIVKKGNGTTTIDSDNQNLSIPATRPTTPTAVRVNPVTIDGAGTITGVTVGMEYRLSGGAWTDVTGTEITNLTVGTYHIRVKATSSSFMSAEQNVTITAFTPGVEATPAITIDYANEQLTGFDASGSYTIDGIAVSPVSGKLEVAGNLGTTITIVQKGNGTTTVDSVAQNLVIPSRPGAPTAVGVNPVTIGGAGTITGVTVGMEYRLSGGAWTDVTGTEITNLTVGTYHIRVKATSSSFMSAEQNVTITAFTPGVEATPAITIDYPNEQLTGFDASGSYTIDGIAVSPVSGKLEVAGNLGTTITIVKKGNGTTTVDSVAQNLVIPSRSGAPTAVGVNPVTIGGTGTITGVTVGMEYRLSGGAWTDVTGTEITNLTVSTYHIRVKATSSSFMSAEQTVTLTEPAPNGGNGGDSSLTTPNYSPIAIDKKANQPTIASVNLSGAVDQNGNAAVTITEAQVKTLINAVKKETTSKGNTADGIGIVFNIQFGADGTSFSVKLEKGTLALLEKEGVKRLDINSKLVNLSFDLAAIREMNAQAVGDVTFGANPVTKLSIAAKVLIGSRPVYDLTVSYQKDDKTEYVTNFGKATVTLGISYKAASGEQNGNLYVVYVNKSGQPELLSSSSFDNNKLMITRNSLSIYGVGYLAQAQAFMDTAKHWAKDNIDYVVSRELMSGISPSTFSPNTAITRADFIMALGKLSGADTNEYKQSSFKDVSITSAAMPYIEWAAQNKIVQGTSDHTFDPESPITREQMAVMMVNYAKATGYKLSVNKQAVTFADDARIHIWAKESVRAIQQTGVVNGKNNNWFDPTGNATRAEASTILRRFLELVIDA